MRAEVRAKLYPNTTKQLSPRETDVMNLLAEGLSNKGIAERLSIGTRSVKQYVRLIRQKRGLPAAATRQAILASVSSCPLAKSMELLAGLTDEEKHIVRLIAEGKRSREIATIVGIRSEQGVKNRVREIYKTIGVHSRLELTAWFFNPDREMKQPVPVQSQSVPATPYAPVSAQEVAERQCAAPQPPANPQYSIGVSDLQTEEEREFREMLDRATEIRFQKQLANARPDGSRCTNRACAFPAVLEGKCRQHAMDAHATGSLLGSSLITGLKLSHILHP